MFSVAKLGEIVPAAVNGRQAAMSNGWKLAQPNAADLVGARDQGDKVIDMRREWPFRVTPCYRWTLYWHVLMLLGGLDRVLALSLAVHQPAIGPEP